MVIRIGRTESSILEINDELLDETHMAVIGRIGQRKTLFTLSLLKQFVKKKDHAVVYIDLGGDQAAYWILRETANAAGKPFYSFSLGNHDCSSWDMINNTPAFADNPRAAASGISMSMKLEHAEGYGRTFWSRLSVADINKALDNLAAAGNTLPSFKEFGAELKRIAESKRGNQTSEAHLAADQLLRYPAITQKRDNELYLSKAFDEGAVVVFHVPTSPDGGAAKAIASMATWCSTIEAGYRTATGKEPRTIHLAVDEYAQIAASKSTVDSTLALARKWGIRMYLVCQDFEQLKTPDGDLSSIIRSQCQQILFTTETKADQDALRYESKDILRQYNSESFQRITSTNQVRDVLEPSLTRNEILDCNGVAMDAFGVFKLGDKHRDPIRFTVVPPTTKAVHAKYKNKPLPKLIPQPKTKPQQPTRNPIRKKTKMQTKFGVMLKRVLAERTWR